MKTSKSNILSKIEADKILIIKDIAAGVLILLSLLLPIVSYTYQDVSYSINGLRMLTGTTVCGGNTVISTSIPVLLIIVCAAVLILSGILMKKLGKARSGILSVCASILGVAANLYFASTVKGILSEAKTVSVSVGSIICLVVTFVIMVWDMYVLWRAKVLSALDFMAIPGMLYFVINNYIPMIGIAIAFKKVDYSVGIFQSPWVGLDNFKQLFSTSTGNFLDSDAFLITKNTILYNVAFIVIGTIMGVLAGICLADICSRFWQKFFQTTILLPQLISYVIVAYIVYALFSNDAGFVNHLLGDENSINFYAQPKYWPFILIFVYVWKMVGYNAIIYLSSIVGIDRSIYEAARVDGANKFKQIFYITLPLLKPTVITLFMLNVGRIMYSDFGLFYQVPMDSGALYSVTNTIDTYVYRCLMTLNNISTSSAACTYQAIIGFVLVFVVNMIIRRKDKENALF